MSKKYTSKYPTIVVDKSTNSANDSMIKKITVEEYYDLKHHTHSIADLSVSEDGMTYGEMQTMVVELSQTINSLNDIIEQQNNIIKQQNDIVQRLEADTTELKRLINVQNNTINEMKQEIANMTSVSDWDVEKPGNQDINGNDLGTLMGFNMTEIF